MKLFTSQTWRLAFVGCIVALLIYGVSQINPQFLQGNIVLNETNVPSNTRLIYIPEVTADIDDTPVFSVKMRTDEAISGFSLKIYDFPELLEGTFDIELHSSLTSSYFSQFKSPAGVQYDATSNTYTLEDVYLDMAYPAQIEENQTIEIATITFNTPVTTAHIGTHPFKVGLVTTGEIDGVQDVFGDTLSFNTSNGTLTITPPQVVSPVQTLLITDYNQANNILTFQWEIPGDIPNEYILIAQHMNTYGTQVFNQRNSNGDSPNTFSMRVNESNPITTNDITIISNTIAQTSFDFTSWLPTNGSVEQYVFQIIAKKYNTEAEPSKTAYRPGDVTSEAPNGINETDFANIFIDGPDLFYPDYKLTAGDAHLTINHVQLGFIYGDNNILHIQAADVIETEAENQTSIDKASPFLSPGIAVPDGVVSAVDAFQIINKVQIEYFAKPTNYIQLFLLQNETLIETTE